MSNETVGLGINQMSAWLGDMIGNQLLGSGIFIGLAFLALLALIIFKGRGGFFVFLVSMTASTMLMAQYGYIPELVGAGVWMLLAVIWAVGLLSLSKE